MFSFFYKNSSILIYLYLLLYLLHVLNLYIVLGLSIITISFKYIKASIKRSCYWISKVRRVKCNIINSSFLLLFLLSLSLIYSISIFILPFYTVYPFSLSLDNYFLLKIITDIIPISVTLILIFISRRKSYQLPIYLTLLPLSVFVNNIISYLGNLSSDSSNSYLFIGISLLIYLSVYLMINRSSYESNIISIKSRSLSYSLFGITFLYFLSILKLLLESVEITLILILILNIYVILRFIKSLEFNNKLKVTVPNKRLSIILSIIFLVLFIYSEGSNLYVLTLMQDIIIMAVVAMGLNLVLGLTGILDLGYIAFFGVGAYLAAIFSGSPNSPIHYHMSMITLIPVVMIVAIICAIIIGLPSMSLEGDYIAIITLGFGEIFHMIVNNSNGVTGPSLTNGPNGISGILTSKNLVKIPGLDFNINLLYIYISITIFVLMLFVFRNIQRSTFGTMLNAISENVNIAKCLGINVLSMRLLSFIIGAIFSSFVGILDAYIKTSVTPDQFLFTDSINLIVILLVGGLGTLLGPLFGSFFVIFLLDKFQSLQGLRVVFLMILIILIVRFKPEGIFYRKKKI